jgi:hypothetical protein
VYVSCSSRDVNSIAKWALTLKDLRIKMLRISEPFDETIEMKELRHLYVGNISSVAGYYMVKLVAACPKVRYFVLIPQFTHLAMLNVWNGGLSEEGIESLASFSSWLFGLNLAKRW